MPPRSCDAASTSMLPTRAQRWSPRRGNASKLQASDGVDVITSTWADLPTNFEPERFDAIFCIGNSIAHAPDAEAAIVAFEAFRSILAPGGMLVLDTHDWELVHNMGSRVEIEPDIVERDGTHCVRTYSWHVPEAFGDPHVLEIAPIFVDGGRATLRSYPVTMWPFTRAELKQASRSRWLRVDRCRRDSRRRAVHRDRAPTEARSPVGPGDAHRQEGLVAGEADYCFDRAAGGLSAESGRKGVQGATDVAIPIPISRKRDLCGARRVASGFLATLMLGTAVLNLGASPAQAQSEDSAQQLAERFAPIIMLKQQSQDCDNDGEPYGPTAADIVLDNPEIALRQVGRDDPVVTWAPSAADLAGLGEGFFLDFPGSSLSPECIYERDFNKYTADEPATVYAHIVQPSDAPDKLVVQYWTYWYYNDWNNKHESDWEGISLLFDASSIEEALASTPIEIGYSQHEGGERATWDSGQTGTRRRSPADLLLGWFPCQLLRRGGLPRTRCIRGVRL